MTKEETIQVLKSIEGRAADFPNMTECDWVAIASAKRHLTNSIEVKEVKEESASMWHNMDEVPIKGEVIVVQTKDTFYGLSVQKGGSTYKNRNKDRYVRWAYASDLLNLSNVQRAVKNWEEPVSEDLEEAANAYIHNESNWTHPRTETFKAGAEWQKQHLIEKACEWLEEHLLDFWSQIITNTDYFIEEFKQAMEE